LDLPPARSPVTLAKALPFSVIYLRVMNRRHRLLFGHQPSLKASHTTRYILGTWLYLFGAFALAIAYYDLVLGETCVTERPVPPPDVCGDRLAPLLQDRERLWFELTPEERTQWTELGGNPSAPLAWWQPAVNATWQGLTVSQRGVAMDLGYDEETWSGCEMAACDVRLREIQERQETTMWTELPPNHQTQLQVLGWQQGLWDNFDNVNAPTLEYRRVTSTGWNELTEDQFRAAVLLGYGNDTWANCSFDRARVEPLLGPCDELSFIRWHEREVVIGVGAESAAMILTSWFLGIFSRKIITNHLSDEAKFRAAMYWKRLDRTGCVLGIGAICAILTFVVLVLFSDDLIAERFNTVMVMVLLLAIFKPLLFFVVWAAVLKGGVGEKGCVDVLVSLFPDLLLVLESTKHIVRRTELMLRNRIALDAAQASGRSVDPLALPGELRGPREWEEAGGMEVTSEFSVRTPQIPTLPPRPVAAPDATGPRRPPGASPADPPRRPRRPPNNAPPAPKALPNAPKGKALPITDATVEKLQMSHMPPPPRRGSAHPSNPPALINAPLGLNMSGSQDLGRTPEPTPSGQRPSVGNLPPPMLPAAPAKPRSRSQPAGAPRPTGSVKGKGKGKGKGGPPTLPPPPGR